VVGGLPFLPFSDFTLHACLWNFVRWVHTCSCTPLTTFRSARRRPRTTTPFPSATVLRWLRFLPAVSVHCRCAPAPFLPLPFSAVPGFHLFSPALSCSPALVFCTPRAVYGRSTVRSISGGFYHDRFYQCTVSHYVRFQEPTAIFVHRRCYYTTSFYGISTHDAGDHCYCCTILFLCTSTWGVYYHHTPHLLYYRVDTFPSGDDPSTTTFLFIQHGLPTYVHSVISYISGVVDVLPTRLVSYYDVIAMVVGGCLPHLRSISHTTCTWDYCFLLGWAYLLYLVGWPSLPPGFYLRSYHILPVSFLFPGDFRFLLHFVTVVVITGDRGPRW